MRKQIVLFVLTLFLFSTPSFAADLKWSCWVVSDGRTLFNNGGTFELFECNTDVGVEYKIDYDCNELSLGATLFHRNNFSINGMGSFQIATGNMIKVSNLHVGGGLQTYNPPRSSLRAIGAAIPDQFFIEKGASIKLRGSQDRQATTTATRQYSDYQIIECEFTPRLP